MSEQTTHTGTDELPDDVLAHAAGAGADALEEKLADARTPGYAAECSPLEAERAGAFREDALSEADAMDSALDAGAVNESAPQPTASNVVLGAFPARNLAGRREA
jgi:hypothetical protein